MFMGTSAGPLVAPKLAHVDSDVKSSKSGVTSQPPFIFHRGYRRCHEGDPDTVIKTQPPYLGKNNSRGRTALDTAVHLRQHHNLLGFANLTTVF